MPACVFVCRECDGSGLLLRGLRKDTGATVVKVGCQKVCREPVAGLMVNRRMEWFGRLDKPKAVDALVRVIRAGGAGKLPPSLKKRRQAKRSGRPPR